MTREEAKIFAALVGRAFYPSERHTHSCVRMLIRGQEVPKEESDDKVVTGVKLRSDCLNLASIYNKMYYEGRNGRRSRTFSSSVHRDVRYRESGKDVQLIRLTSGVEAERVANLLTEMYKSWLDDPI